MKKASTKAISVLVITLLLSSLTLISIGQPANDDPCSAQFLPLGLYVSGNNALATNVSEPARPGCFDASTLHSVWYRIIAPAGGCVTIKTSSGTLTDTQIGVYSGTCGPSLTLISAPNCNDNVAGCSGFTYTYSYLQLSGLSVGVSYYIMVDGRNASSGSFSIYAYNACPGNSLPPVPGQDCALPFQVCSYNNFVANPGYAAYGNICDFPAPSGCLGQGEKGTVWYQVTTNGVGTLEFDIVPNDYFGACNLAQTDYDFAVWKLAGAGSTACGSLTGANMVRCNYSAYGVTGCYGPTNGTASPPYSFCAGFNGAYMAGIPVVAGEVYVICISNFDVTNSGFSLNIQPTTPIATSVPPGGTSVWTGSISTDWFNVGNWGGCQIPDCSRNATIPSFPVNQPVINAAGASVRTLTINSGASLTVNSTYSLMVCNDFTNDGSFNAMPNSTVIFEDTAVTAPLTNLHTLTINGSVTAPNDFWNVIVRRPAGAGNRVIANQDIDMAGDFLISGAATFGGNFDASTRYHKVGGNFTVEVAPLIATYTNGIALEFNGTTQTYLNRGNLNNVVMNQTAPGTLTLQNHGAGTAWMFIGGTGSLTLNYGKIITSNNANSRVEINNRSFAALTAGNANSYVENISGAPIGAGLRKYLNTGGVAATGTYEFPVGTAGRGYQRMQWNLTSGFPATVNFVTVTFNETVAGSNAALGPECGAPNYHTLGATALNNGVWEVRPTVASNFDFGTLDVTLFNGAGSYSNASAGYTVQYNRISGTIGTAANWFLNPFPTGCFGNPPISAVIRRGINVTTVMDGASTVYFNTAQTTIPLPVELLSFDAFAIKDDIRLAWITASEENNSGFEIERSLNNKEGFEVIGWIEGKGTTTTNSYYTFTDKQINPNEVYYYRLKQIDYNGNFDYSNIVSARVQKETFAFHVIPNPYSGETSISYNLQQPANVVIEVVNVMGQKIATLFKGGQEEGVYNYEFSANKLGYSKGIYTVRVVVNDDTYTQRILETE